ncbi:MAG: hypothetical protein HQK78_11330 [Desulfobacterales bacterium]|nr:hypothetical protein [Desulfobacterales bacterium]
MTIRCCLKLSYRVIKIESNLKLIKNIMNVRVELKLTSLPKSNHEKQMIKAANKLTDETDDKNSVATFNHPEMSQTIVAEFTITKARQMDVVDKIGKVFRFIDDYSNIMITFPKKREEKIPKKHTGIIQAIYNSFKIKKLFILLSFLYMQGCSYNSWYEGMKEIQRQECYKYTEPERTRCLEKIKDYGEYSRERKEVIKKK